MKIVEGNCEFNQNNHSILNKFKGKENSNNRKLS